MYLVFQNMQSALTVDGKQYIPANDAGKHFGYTREYMLMLAKQGKIDGKKIGHKWYVHEPSIENFFRKAVAYREVSKKETSKARKEELKLHDSHRRKKQVSVALTETFAILLIGLAVGTFGYAGFSSQTVGAGFVNNIALSLYSLLNRENQASVGVQSEGIPDPVATGLIAAPQDVLDADALDEARKSFADPVRITRDSESADTGIVTPIFKDGEGETYRFLMVPVKKE
jgi:hypothetical protein